MSHQLSHEEFLIFFSAWKEARRRLAAIILAGVDRPERELARDANYNGFLRAGVMIRNLGGEAAIRDAAAFLESCFHPRDIRLGRLWAGLDR